LKNTEFQSQEFTNKLRYNTIDVYCNPGCKLSGRNAICHLSKQTSCKKRLICVELQNSTMAVINDPNLNMKVKKTVEKISENMHIVGNEPSLAFYRIQEHCRKVLPLIVDRRAEVEYLQQELQGKCYDLEYAVGAVKSIQAAETPVQNIQELLKNAIFLKQQLKYEENKKAKKEASSNSSVYKRLSAHITLDMPDISGVMRETTNRVENMMIRTNSTGSQSELQRSYTTLH